MTSSCQGCFFVNRIIRMSGQWLLKLNDVAKTACQNNNKPQKSNRVHFLGMHNISLDENSIHEVSHVPTRLNGPDRTWKTQRGLIRSDGSVHVIWVAMLITCSMHWWNKRDILYIWNIINCQIRHISSNLLGTQHLIDTFRAALNHQFILLSTQSLVTNRGFEYWYSTRVLGFGHCNIQLLCLIESSCSYLHGLFPCRSMDRRRPSKPFLLAMCMPNPGLSVL